MDRENKTRESLPETYQGYATAELLQVWEDIKKPGGTQAPPDKILAMGQLLKTYRLGLFAHRDQWKRE